MDLILDVDIQRTYLMAGIVDDISDESDDFSENFEMSDESDENIEIEDDPDYVPSVPMEEPVDEDTQSSAEDSPDYVNYVPSVPMEERVDEDTQSSVEDVPSPNPVHHDEQNSQPPEPAKPPEPTRSVELVDRPIVASQRGLDDDGQNCSICFEPWTNSSEHRLVSLRCGHLFGRSCISRWLKGQSGRCPQCNARARRSEIRNLYAKSLKVIDTSEHDKALENLEREAKLRVAAEKLAAQERMKHNLAVMECERVKKELMEARKQLHEYRSSLKRSRNPQAADLNSGFSLIQSINISRDGGCRIVDSCNIFGMLLVSQPSPYSTFPGFGFRKISTLDMKPSEFVLVHQKLIRDMAFHLRDGLVLTASVDKTLKITNVLTNTVVQTYNVEGDVWSCAWDADNCVCFYGGLKTGEVYVFDIRMTNRYVSELPRFGAKTPVVSLQYLSGSNIGSNSGPVVGKLSDSALHQKTKTDGDYNILPIPVLGPYTCLSSENSGHLLVSARPSPRLPYVTHTVCDFVRTPTDELVCNPITTVTAGRTQVQLTRSKLLSHPDKESSVLICAGDEDAHGALIWDGSSGKSVCHLRTDSPVLDLSTMNINRKPFLTALTSRDLLVYQWMGL